MSIKNTLKKIIEENITNFNEINYNELLHSYTKPKENINIEYIYNSEEELSNKDILNLIYIDNISRIMEYSGYEITKEIYIKNNNTNSNINIIIDTLKKELDYYRININTYSTSKELIDNYYVEDTLTKLRYNNKCYLDNNETLLINPNNKCILIDKDGNYTDLAIDITHIINKKNNNYDKIIICNNNIDKNLIDSIKILKLPTNKVELIDIKENKNIDLKNKEDINYLRYISINNKLQKEELKKIETINSNIEKIIKNNKNIIDKNNNLNNKITYNMINKLIDYETTINSACFNPNLLVDYCIELKNITNEFLEKNKELNTFDISLLKIIQKINNDILKLIGIIPKDYL